MRAAVVVAAMDTRRLVSVPPLLDECLFWHYDRRPTARNVSPAAPPSDREPCVFVLRTIGTARAIADGSCGDFTARLDPCGMDGIRSIRCKTFLGVLDISMEFAGDVLVQRTSEADVEALTTIADCQHWLAGGEGVVENSKIGFFPVRVGVVSLLVAGGAVERRIHVGGRAGEDKGVQISDLSCEFIWRKLERHMDSLTFGCGDRSEVILKLVGDLLGFFVRSAPRDAHTGAAGGFRLGISRGHGTPNRSIRAGRRQPEVAGTNSREKRACLRAKFQSTIRHGR